MESWSNRSSSRHDRSREVRRLLEHAWSVARVGAQSAPPSSARLAATLASFRLDVALAGTFLSVRITENLELSINVWMTVNWDSRVESALWGAVRRSTSPLMGLVLAEWGRVCDACRTAALIVRETGVEPRAAMVG